MAIEFQALNIEKAKDLALRHFSKLVGVAVGVSSVLLITVTWSILTSHSDVTPPLACHKTRVSTTSTSSTSSSTAGRLGDGDRDAGGTGCSGQAEGCPWQFVLSDVTHRLHLLEAAFKEQVLAREMMALEVSNQSDSNLMTEQKLLMFLRRVEELERMVKKVEGRMHDLSTRLHSDEFIGFVVILAVMVEVLLRVRPRVGDIRPWGSDMMARYRRWSQGPDITVSSPSTSSATNTTTTTINSAGASGTPNGNGNRSSVDGRGAEVAPGAEHHHHHANGAAPQVLKSAAANGVSFSPKHGLFLKPELCVIGFRKDHAPLTNFITSTLRHLDDVRLSIRPYYVIEGHEHLRQCPRAKLYLVIFEMEERVSSSPRAQDPDLITSTVRYVKSLGANLILVVTNDEGSRKLTVHALYNTHLRLLQSHEAFQDLTSSGRVFSAWRELTSHQTSHMRKIVKTTLNPKTNLR